MARGSELARDPLLGLKLSSISSSRLVSRLCSARLGSSRGSARLISDSTRLYPAGYPGIGSVTLRKLRWIWFFFFFGCCNHEKYATSSGSRIFFLQTDFILTFFFVRGFSSTRLLFWSFSSRTLFVCVLFPLYKKLRAEISLAEVSRDKPNPELASRSKPSRADPSRAEPGRAGSSSLEPRIEPWPKQRSRAESSRALTQAESSPESKTGKSGSSGSDQIWMKNIGAH